MLEVILSYNGIAIMLGVALAASIALLMLKDGVVMFAKFQRIMRMVNENRKEGWDLFILNTMREQVQTDETLHEKVKSLKLADLH